jgi:hypothetical protein
LKKVEDVEFVEALRNAITLKATSAGLNEEIIEAIQTMGEATLETRDVE